MNLTASGEALAVFIESVVTKTIDAAIRDGRLQAVQQQQKGPKKRTLTTKDVSQLYNVPAGTLAEWRRNSKGPAWTKPGKSVLYRVEDVEAYFDAQRVRTLASDRCARPSR